MLEACSFQPEVSLIQGAGQSGHAPNTFGWSIDINGNAEVPRGRHEAVLSLELLPELFKLPFQILDFFLEFADSIQLNLWFREPDFTGKEMRITDFFLAALPRQSHNERGFA